MPDAYLVSAKDKAGHPVSLFINPNSMTELIGTNAPAQSDATTAGAFASIPETDDLSSKVVGLDVYNNANQDIGTIKDIAFDPNGARDTLSASAGSSVWATTMSPCVHLRCRSLTTRRKRNGMRP